MKFIKWLFFLLIIAVGVAGVIGNNFYQDYINQKLPHDVTSFSIKKGSNIRQVAKDLAQKDIFKPAIAFTLLAKLSKQDRKIKAGEFSLKKGMTANDVLNHFTSGKTIQYKTTLIEGKTFKEIIKVIKADPNLKQTLSDDDYKNIMTLMGTEEGKKYSKPEGWFFPDTYSYPRNTTDLQFLKRSHQAMLKKLKKAWEGRKQYKGINSIYDALILASIVEKETGQSSERPMIARVFLNRLEKGMMLQTDPTIIYGIGDSFDGNIRKRDLKKDNPYNTYTRKGLTPTPITTPGAEDINAVFHPADSKALYFVARGDGTSYFSNTYSEHKKAVRQYQLRRNKK
ncbi:MAG: endolytic transglycosylase MltG [Cocleimonas sp.]|nr:endolytic transglycosylase MltG [Sulfurovaceae bacterium]MCK5919000.1 endolytic transglycosylase MltG [Cocleimonas sp.]